jgi:alcohol dehydrogenase
VRARASIPVARCRCRGRLYTLGIRFSIGRAHSVGLLPQVMPLIEEGRLRPQCVTTRVVDWDDAPEAFLEPAIKLIMRRDRADAR